MENPSLWLTAPILLAGSSTLVHGLHTRIPIVRRRAAILSIIALTLGSATVYVPCSGVERILGAIDILIGALVLAVVL
jgi:hypothetical protein